jgi:hypothetical protein
MAPPIGECLPEILELKVALVLVEFEPLEAVPFLVQSELFHGEVVEDQCRRVPTAAMWETQTMSWAWPALAFLVAFSLIALSFTLMWQFVSTGAPKAGLLTVAPRRTWPRSRRARSRRWSSRPGRRPSCGFLSVAAVLVYVLYSVHDQLRRRSRRAAPLTEDGVPRCRTKGGARSI